ncbi:MAG: TIGR04149 family rSAM-modified RiPP [Dysgonamonadaceae bacterium]|nr:TIGR04149 family rSAM-modified RiPP [Dysgonamonadaceae bacterium]
MKTNIKLNALASQSLSGVEMNQTKGGNNGCCACACAYEGQPGGSSYNDNGGANSRAGKSSPQLDAPLWCP